MPVVAWDCWVTQNPCLQWAKRHQRQLRPTSRGSLGFNAGNPVTLGSMRGKGAGALPPELALKWYLLCEGIKKECSERCQALQANLERLIHLYYLLAFWVRLRFFFKSTEPWRVGFFFSSAENKNGLYSAQVQCQALVSQSLKTVTLKCLLKNKVLIWTDWSSWLPTENNLKVKQELWSLWKGAMTPALCFMHLTHLVSSGSFGWT